MTSNFEEIRTIIVNSIFVPDASPVQASSIAPVSDNKDESLILKQETPVSDQKLKEPRVMLNRIRPEVSNILSNQAWVCGFFEKSSCLGPYKIYHHQIKYSILYMKKSI